MPMQEIEAERDAAKERLERYLRELGYEKGAGYEGCTSATRSSLFESPGITQMNVSNLVITNEV